MTFAAPIAALAVTEWLGAAAAALSVIGYVYRAAKGVMRRVDAVLQAVAANTEQNRQLLARADRTDQQLLEVKAEQSRSRRDEQTLQRTVAQEVVPKLEAVQEQTANGGAT